MKMLAYSVLAAVGLMLVGAGVQAQSTNNEQNQGSANANAMTRAKQSPHIMDAATRAEWETSIYEAGGLRAEYILTEEVFGPEGEEIGNVQNVIVSEEGQIVAIIAEVGGFWDISDTHIAVPWEEVTLIPDGLKIPVTEENFDTYVLFGENSFVTMEGLQQANQVDHSLSTGPQLWKLTALMGEYVTLDGGVGYGYVDDVIFTKDGKIQGIVTRPTAAMYGYGPYVYPYYGYAWAPYGGAYALPYTAEEVAALEPFQYEMFTGYWQ